MKEFVISEAQVETAILVGLITQTQDERKTMEYLDELEFLAETAGATVVKRYTQKLPSANSVTYVGKGKLEEIKEYILIVKDELSFSGIKGCQEPKDLKQIKLIWGIIKIGISTFLMKQSYDQLKENRIKRFFAQKQKKFQNEKINEDEIIKLALTGIGSSFQVTLIYHIEK